jgi:hypothetical protein
MDQQHSSAAQREFHIVRVRAERRIPKQEWAQNRGRERGTIDELR